MSRGRSPSPRSANDGDIDMDTSSKPYGDHGSTRDAKVIVVTNLTRNVVEAHLRTVFNFYGHVTKVDLPLYSTSGQNRGKAALEFSDSIAAHKAVSHMNGGQLDGQVLKVELSNLPIRTRSRSPPRRGAPGGGGAGARNGGRRRNRSYSPSRSRSRTRSPVNNRRRASYRDMPSERPSYRGGRGGGGGGGHGAGGGGRRGGGGGYPDLYRPRSRTRSRSPVRRGGGGPPLRRRSPSYSRGGTGYDRRGRSRTRSRTPSYYSVRSSRSRTPRSVSRSRSRSPRSRSRSYDSYSRYSRSASRSRSVSRPRRSYSRDRDDVRDSRSRSRTP